MSEEKETKGAAPTKVKPKRPKIPRQPMPEQDAHERAKNFGPVTLGYSEEQAVTEATRCIQCKKPFCIGGCPVSIDIPGFIQLVKDKEFLKAAQLVKETNLLPAVCGRVCPQEDQCEKLCVLSKKQDPVAIGRLERFVADYEAEHGEMPLPEMPPKTGKKIAVVGAGPGGLTVAGDLIMLNSAIAKSDEQTELKFDQFIVAPMNWLQKLISNIARWLIQ